MEKKNNGWKKVIFPNGWKKINNGWKKMGAFIDILDSKIVIRHKS
jgi:hypothetical protein